MTADNSPRIYQLPITENLSIPMVRVPAGMARIGQRGGESDEEPVCRIRIPHAFFMGENPITQEQFSAWQADSGPSGYTAWFESKGQEHRLKGHQKSHFSGNPRHPVESVSWWEACSFAAWATRCATDLGVPPEMQQRGALPTSDRWQASLPTEVEWEYACRWGLDEQGRPVQTDTEYWSGDGEAALQGVAHFDKDGQEGRTCAVDDPRFRANGLGLRHMHGNFWEWCLDPWDEERYRRLPGRGLVPKTHYSEDAKTYREVRGHRAASRFATGPGDRFGVLGFRLAWVPGSGDRNGSGSGGAGGPEKHGAERTSSAKARRDAAAGAVPERGAGGVSTAFIKGQARNNKEDKT